MTPAWIVALTPRQMTDIHRASIIAPLSLIRASFSLLLDQPLTDDQTRALIAFVFREPDPATSP